MSPAPVVSAVGTTKAGAEKEVLAVPCEHPGPAERCRGQATLEFAKNLGEGLQ